MCSTELLSTATSDTDGLKCSVFITPCRELDQSSSLKILAQTEKYRPNFNSKKTLGCGSTRVRQMSNRAETHSSQLNASQMDCSEISSQSVATATANTSRSLCDDLTNSFHDTNANNLFTDLASDSKKAKSKKDGNTNMVHVSVIPSQNAEGSGVFRKSDHGATEITSTLTSRYCEILEDEREFSACKTRAHSEIESQCSEYSCTEMPQVLVSEDAVNVKEPHLIHHSNESHNTRESPKNIRTDKVEHGVGACSDGGNYKNLPETSDVSLASHGSEHIQGTSNNGRAVEMMMSFDDFVDISDSQLCTLDDLTR